MSKAAIVIHPDNVDGDNEFADLCNAVLRAEHPDVTFTEADDLNRLVRGNGATDVSDDIDYEAVVTSTAAELTKRLGA